MLRPEAPDGILLVGSGFVQYDSNDLPPYKGPVPIEACAGSSWWLRPAWKTTGARYGYDADQQIAPHPTAEEQGWPRRVAAIARVGGAAVDATTTTSVYGPGATAYGQLSDLAEWPGPQGPDEYPPEGQGNITSADY